MSFTQDELQALDVILDQKIAGFVSELEQLFDQRMQSLRKEFVQEQKRLEEGIERSFAAQLFSFEQLINQRFSASGGDLLQTSLDAIEVQTEIPWEELINLLNNALNEQFATFNTSLQARLHDIEHEVSSQLQLLRDVQYKEQPVASREHTTEAEMQDILTSISQLERVVESMQVAMTANSTLLSQRLYHHQRLPIERAHSSLPLSPAEHEHSLSSEWNFRPSPLEETDA